MTKISATENFNDVIARTSVAAPHLVPMLRILRDYGLVVLQVRQGSKTSFWRAPDYASGRPWLVFLGDDAEQSLRLGAFHRQSVRRLFREAGHVTINAAAPYPHPYASTALVAVLDPAKPSVLIECLPSTQDAWIQAAKRQGIKDG